MDTQQAILQAKKSADDNDYAAAQKILKEVISQDPKNVDAWLTLAEVVQNPEVAEKCLQRVLQIDPGNQAAQQRLQKPASPPQDPDYHPGEPKPAPQSLDARLQSVAQPEMELADPWEVPQQTAPPPRPAPPEAVPPSPPKQKEPSKPKRSGRWVEISLIGVLCVMAICVLGLFLFLPKNASGGDGGTAAEAAQPEDDPVAVIFANIDASNAESVPHYMATIHSNSPSYQSTKEMTKEAFGLFDLSYRISGIKIKKQTSNEAVVAFTLTTQKIRGPNFRDNRITGDMILRKEDGKWKIYNQVVHDVKYLN
jgi:tetratricopeptide (TPR) repeat protein